MPWEVFLENESVFPDPEIWEEFHLQVLLKMMGCGVLSDLLKNSITDRTDNFIQLFAATSITEGQWFNTNLLQADFWATGQQRVPSSNL